MSSAQESTFTDQDGLEIFYRHWPAPAPRGAVVIAHGASEHSGRYGRFAAALNDAGWTAFALDHRGHGITGQNNGVGRAGPGGGIRFVDDIRQLVSLASEAVEGRPVVLFGHSMGSAFAQAYATHGADGLAGYVLSGPLGAPDGADEMAAGLKEAADAGMADETVDMLGPFNEPFEPARTPVDWLSRDEAEVDAYIADPFCGDSNPLTYGYVAEFLGLATPSVSSEAIATIPSIPVLLVTGDQDPVSEGGKWVRVLEERLQAAGLQVTSHYYPGARHEVLNETNRDEVTSDIVAWLEKIG
jgi:alpha-beta hydrolase superfamily lysophospholipase